METTICFDRRRRVPDSVREQLGDIVDIGWPYIMSRGKRYYLLFHASDVLAELADGHPILVTLMESGHTYYWQEDQNLCA